MALYRRKPVAIEATQWFKFGDHAHVEHDAEPNHGWIKTLEGGHVVTPGDWIMTGVEGEHYPVKPHVFVKIYERADIRQPPRAEIETVLEKHLPSIHCDHSQILIDLLAVWLKQDDG